MLNRQFSEKLVFGGRNFKVEMGIITLISGMKLLLFVVPSIFFVAIRKILKLEEPICLFAGTAREGGSWD